MIRITTSLATRTGECGNTRSCVDDDGLTLGGGRAYPNIDIVGAIALVEGSHLLLQTAILDFFGRSFIVGGLGMTRDARPRRQRGIQLGAELFVEFTTAAIEMSVVRDERVSDGASFTSSHSHNIMLLGVRRIERRRCCVSSSALSVRGS